MHFGYGTAEQWVVRNKCVFVEDRRLDKGPGSDPVFQFEGSGQIDLNSFMLDGWLKLGLRLSRVRSDEYVKDEYFSKVPQVRIQVLKDHHIRKNVASNASTDVFCIPIGCIFFCPPNRSLKAVKNMVCSKQLTMDTEDPGQFLDSERCSTGFI